MKPKVIEWSAIGVSEFANHEEWGLLIKTTLVTNPDDKDYEYNAFGLEELGFVWIDDSESVEPIIPQFQYKNIVLS